MFTLREQTGSTPSIQAISGKTLGINAASTSGSKTLEVRLLGDKEEAKDALVETAEDSAEVGVQDGCNCRNSHHSSSETRPSLTSAAQTFIGIAHKVAL